MSGKLMGSILILGAATMVKADPGEMWTTSNLTQGNANAAVFEQLKPTNLYIATTKAPIVISASMDIDSKNNLVTIYPNGSVKFGPEYKGDEAATEFWTALAKVFPNFLKDKKDDK